MIRSVDGVHGVSRLVLHDYGPEDINGVAKIEVSARLTVKELERITKEIERKVLEETGVELIVGI